MIIMEYCALPILKINTQLLSKKPTMWGLSPFYRGISEQLWTTEKLHRKGGHVCDTKNVLYVMTCPGCNEYCIGKMSNPYATPSLPYNIKLQIQYVKISLHTLHPLRGVIISLRLVKSLLRDVKSKLGEVSISLYDVIFLNCDVKSSLRYINSS